MAIGSFIVFEGLDGTGKTTISKTVASAINAVYVGSPPPEYNLLRKFIYVEGDFLARFFYFLSSNVMTSTRIEKLLKGNSVVCNRYIYSTIADFSYYRPPHRASEEVFAELSNLCLSLVLEPDVVVYLTCQYKERKRRVRCRVQDEMIEVDNLDVKYGEVVHQAYLEIARSNWVTIDTTGKDIQTCVKMVMTTLDTVLHKES